MTLFEALTEGEGGAVYRWHEDGAVLVEECGSRWHIKAMRSASPDATEHPKHPITEHETTVDSWDELVATVAGDPYYCDPDAGWEEIF